MESCNCTSDCISKTSVPLTNLRLIITSLFIRYPSLRENELAISDYVIEVAKGVTEKRFMELKFQWLKAKYSATCFRFFFYNSLKYVDNCKMAQALLRECIKMKKFKEYVAFRERHSKMIEKFLSIGMTTRDWEELLEAKKQELLAFKLEYSDFLTEREKCLAESIQNDKELIRLRELIIEN
ncbi:GSCOCG00004454001-RA-CDS [Cotesia congregata]|nr:GSCOCG00004454001-RA-CDS [Cotesia congregata]